VTHTPIEPQPASTAWSHPAALDDEALLTQCDLGRQRTSGPGGQHRNKVETQVSITHRPTGISAKAGERRSVRENRPVAIKRLRLKLAAEHRCPVPIGEIGSDLWRSRRTPPRKPAPGQEPSLGAIACNPKHHDYPSLLAEALDVIAAADWDVKKAALRLDVSASQLVKLIKDHPPALELLNRHRASRGMRAYR